MNLRSTIKQRNDWRRKLKKKTNEELLSLYSETVRVNLEPQIVAGQILNSRNYDKKELIRIKENLIIALREQFERKYGKTESEMMRDIILKEIFIKTFMGVMLFVSLKIGIDLGLFLSEFEFRDMVPYVGLILSLVPLLNYKKSNERAIRHVKQRKIELEYKVKIINQGLFF